MQQKKVFQNHQMFLWWVDHRTQIKMQEWEWASDICVKFVFAWKNQSSKWSTLYFLKKKLYD